LIYIYKYIYIYNHDFPGSPRFSPVFPVGCPLAPLARQVWKVLEAVFTAFFIGEIVAGTEDNGAQKTLEKTISIFYIYITIDI
jgi:hypothetical protein